MAIKTTRDAIGPEKLAPGVMPGAVRRGASVSASNYVVSAPWASTGGGIEYAFTLSPGGSYTNGNVLGRTGAGNFHLVLDGGGSLRVTGHVENILSTPADTFLLDHRHEVRVVLESGASSLLVDGVVINTSTATFAHSTTPIAVYIGSASANQYGTVGILSDVKLIDLADDTNTAVFRLDGDFLNSHPGSAVADATVTGFVPFAKVLGDSGKPVPVGRSVYLHSGTGVSQVIDGGVATFTSGQLNAATLNETGALNTGTATIFTAPVDGLLHVTALVEIAANADSADTGSLEFRNSGAIISTQSEEIGSVTAATTHEISSVSQFAAGDGLGMLLNSVADATTSSFTILQLHLEFYPTAP